MVTFVTTLCPSPSEQTRFTTFLPDFSFTLRLHLPPATTAGLTFFWLTRSVAATKSRRSLQDHSCLGCLDLLFSHQWPKHAALHCQSDSGELHSRRQLRRKSPRQLSCLTSKDRCRSPVREPRTMATARTGRQEVVQRSSHDRDHRAHYPGHRVHRKQPIAHLIQGTRSHLLQR